MKICISDRCRRGAMRCCLLYSGQPAYCQTLRRGCYSVSLCCQNVRLCLTPSVVSKTALPTLKRGYASNRLVDLSEKRSMSSSLAILPLSTVIRSLSVTTVSSSPVLLDPSLTLLSFLAQSKSAFLDPDRNAILKLVLEKTLYAQFCAGETPEAVQITIQKLKNMGYSGVILGYAKEVVMDEVEANTIATRSDTDLDTDGIRAQDTQDILMWEDGTLKTVDMAKDGDFVALKFSGAGRQALRHLLRGLPPSPELERAIVEICNRARERNVRLLFDAEQQAVQGTIDSWVLRFQRRYNVDFRPKGQERALIYGTYQAYLHSTPTTLARHLAVAQNEGFVLGVKLVRGAYLGSDPRHLIHDTKPDTDRAYDSIAKSLITRQYGDLLTPAFLSPNPSAASDLLFPQVNLVLATHNRASIKKARTLRNSQVSTGQPMIDMVYGQLQGMADDISCQLVQESNTIKEDDVTDVEAPKTYKYLVWGTVGECTKYMLRRGQENRDAVLRTKDTKEAMFVELRRRWAQHH